MRRGAPAPCPAPLPGREPHQISVQIPFCPVLYPQLWPGWKWDASVFTEEQGLSQGVAPGQISSGPCPGRGLGRRKPLWLPLNGWTRVPGALHPAGQVPQPVWQDCCGQHGALHLWPGYLVKGFRLWAQGIWPESLWLPGLLCMNPNSIHQVTFTRRRSARAGGPALSPWQAWVPSLWWTLQGRNIKLYPVSGLWELESLGSLARALH